VLAILAWLASLAGLVIATLLLLTRLLSAALLAGLIALLLLARLLVGILVGVLVLTHAQIPPNVVGFCGSKTAFETFRPTK